MYVKIGLGQLNLKKAKTPYTKEHGRTRLILAGGHNVGLPDGDLSNVCVNYYLGSGGTENYLH